MSEMSEFESRISAALERIGRAVAVVEERAVSDPQETGLLSEEMEAEIARLRDALADEEEHRLALEAELLQGGAPQDTDGPALQAENKMLRDQIGALDIEIQRLVAANEALRSNVASLRAAHAGGLSDARLVNASLEAELEALRAERSAERAELDAVLADLHRLTEADDVDTNTTEEM